MPAIQIPKSVQEVLKLIAKHGKRSVLVSGVDPGGDRLPPGKIVIDLTAVAPLHEIERKRDKVTIATGMNLGRLARDAVGENGLLRQAASIIANPLVRNRVTFVEALDPDSPYFDITTPLVLLEAKARLQSPSGKRTLNIRDFLEYAIKGLKKGELPTAVEFSTLVPAEKVGFFRVARMGGKGSVSAAAKMKLVRMVCVDPEIVVSSLTLIPLRAKLAEKEIAGKPAQEILQQAEKENAYETTLIEITVARTLRSIMEGSIPV